MKKNTFFTLTCILIGYLVNAQVLFTENFDSYTNGDLNASYDNTTPGKGGWVTGGLNNLTAKAIVTPETGMGKVLEVSSTNATTPTTLSENININKDIELLWKNRAAGNNILKFKFDCYIADNIITNVHLAGSGVAGNLLRISYNAQLNQIIVVADGKVNHLKNNADPFPFAIWITTEMYIDFNTNKIYYYIPNFNMFYSTTSTSNLLPKKLHFFAGAIYTKSAVKYDNIELSALPSLPSYILSSKELTSAKFSIYPNPAENIVTITNSDNLFVNKVQIYDLSGKLVNTQNFYNAQEIKFNIEALASGTYSLHLQTDQGLAIKKLIKK